MAAPRRTLALVACALVVAGVLGAPITNSLQPFSSDDPGSQSVAARRAIERVTGVDPYFNLVALVQTPSGLDSAQGRARVATVERAIGADPTVVGVRSYYLDHDPAMVALDRRSTYVVGVLRATSVSSQLAGARGVENRLSSLRGVKLGGLAAFYAQGNDTARQDLIRAELFAFPLLLVIALWVFRGLVAALLPLLVGAVTIVSTLALLRVTSEFTNVSIYALNITTALGLGLAVDYSLLIVSRYREEIALSGPDALALRRTLSSAGRTVITSSLTVAGVLSSLLVFPQPFLRSIGFGGMLVSLLAGVSALVILGSVLTLLRWRVNLLSPARWRRAAYDHARLPKSGSWYRISRLVMARPWTTALISGAILLSLASPVLGLRITQVDSNVVPANSGARVVHDAIQGGFPATNNSPLFLAVEASTSKLGRTSVASYAARLSHLPGALAVEGPTPLGARLWQINVVPASAPLSSASQHLVAEIRSMRSAFPVLVGGESASLVDLRHSLAGHLPLALAVVIAVTLIAVFLMTSSAVLAITALLMSALTILAVFGAMVTVFQNGALEGVLGYTSSHALEPSTLVLIFAMSFGLATDYGIFLLSRIKEVRDRGASDSQAVADGLQRTGPVVTAAALLLCVALGSLMTARHALVKEVGFGAALAVAIDATLVRAMLLPAVMGLLGRRSWWAPGALKAATPRARTRAAGDGVLRRAPGSPAPAGPSSALRVSPFCDHDHPTVRNLVRELRERVPADDEVAFAVTAFEFVRDRVLYTLGPWGVPASATLRRYEGTCTNKANLLVALLRGAGLPAAYGVLRVNAREYFGALGPSFLTRSLSAESVHIHAAAYLNGRWVKCDPSTDRELAALTSHYCQQTRLIEWDGIHDSLDFLDPRHVFADLGLFANIDELLRRPARSATPEFLASANHWVQFIRSNPPFESGEALADAYKSARAGVTTTGSALRSAGAEPHG